MYRNYLLLTFGLFTSCFIFAQSNILNAKSAQDIGKKNEQQLLEDNDGPIPYGYVDDRDIMWSKVVWEFVDLSQKINLPYYFPIDTTNVPPSKRSLFDTTLKAIKQGKIEDIYEDSYFTTKATPELIQSRLVDVRTENGYTDSYKIQSQDIGGFMLKGMWYFDKRQGELRYRLLAFAPMSNDVSTLGREGIEEDELYELFWVFYPSARQVLHESKVFNPMNSSSPISYDHLLNARRFSGVIVREENIYGNRSISDYVRGNSLFQLLEADKIKESIRNREMDMWNY